MIRNQKGQSTLEYIVLVTAVIIVILAFVMNKEGSFQKKVGNTLNVTTDLMGTFANDMAKSHD